MTKDFNNSWHSSDPRLAEAWTVRIILTFLAVTIRLYCKATRSGVKRFSWDDAAIVFAFITSTVAAGVLLWGRQQGGLDIPMETLIEEGGYQGEANFLLAEFVATVFEFMTLTLIRISILYFYMTVFGTAQWFRRWAWGLIIFSAMWWIACEFGIIFNCWPVDYYWHRLKEGNCHNALLFYLITIIIEILADAVIFALPIRPIMKLSLPLRTRVLIGGIFALGAFAIITNILRLYYTYQHNGKYADLYKVPLWMSIHITAATICACLPLYKPFMSKIVEVSHQVSQYAISLLSLSRGSSQGSHGSSNARSQRSINMTGFQRAQSGSKSSQEGIVRSQGFDISSEMRPDLKDHMHISEVSTHEQKHDVERSPSSATVV